jgi:FkbM family methyltransferase
MKMVHGIALPDGDTHFPAHLAKGPLFDGKGTYQLHKLKPAVEVCTRNRLAVDVGAHVGLWTRVLARMFDEVIAFEPVPEHIECFRKNTEHLSNVKLYPWAVGSRGNGGITIATVPGNSGNAHANVGGGPYVKCCQLDTMNLPPVDFLKIDVEGYELFVIEGGRDLIRRDKPVIVCEQKPGNAERYGLGQTDAVTLLCTWGYKVVWEKQGDYCLKS